VNVADIRGLFPGLQDTIYLNTATLAVGCTPARAAYERAIDRWAAGRFDWMEAEQAGEDARALFAQIVGARPEEVAIVPAVSSAAGIVAANMPPATRGENIVRRQGSTVGAFLQSRGGARSRCRAAWKRRDLI
jgi:selenocysteine lyase/cysteine desulfurase